MKRLVFILCIIQTINGFAQSIVIDSEFDDWIGVTTYTDPLGDGGNLDLLEVSITNDDDHLYIRFKTAQEFGLVNPNYTNTKLYLYIDADADPSTGYQGLGFGSEAALFFGERFMFFDYPSALSDSLNINQSGVTFRPTVTGSEYELSIPRDVRPDGVTYLFQETTIRLFLSTSQGDRLPNAGSNIYYTFSNGPFQEYNTKSIDRTPDSFRVMAFNTLGNGITDPNRQSSFERILIATDPDIIAFNEVSNVNVSTITSLLNSWIPIGGNGWYAERASTQLITASRFPITNAQIVWNHDRVLACEIDLPDSLYHHDLLLINAHYSCCGSDIQRQDQIDATAEFILDAKSPGGAITLVGNTPIVVAGDFNLVGWSAQLQTLQNGTIFNSGTYGSGSPLDWDNSILDNTSSLHTHTNQSFTWREQTTPFPPGKLDFILYSGSVLEEKHSFTLDTEELPSDVLSDFNLLLTDTYVASDHLPVVADFYPAEPLGVPKEDVVTLAVYPNPVDQSLHIETNRETAVELFNAEGKRVYNGMLSVGRNVLDLSDFSDGIYYLKTANNESQLIVVTH